MARFCTKCGVDNDPVAKFCEQCGASFSTVAAATGANVTHTAPAKAAGSGRRTLLVTLGVLALAIVAGSVWHYMSPNRPSENAFAKVLSNHYATDKALSESLSCLNNAQYGRNPIYANPWDNRMKDWMALLVSSGLYTGPEQVTSGEYFKRAQLKYEWTELGSKSIRDGKLCFADGVRVSKVSSFTPPQNVGGRDATLVSYAIEFVNQAEWAKHTEFQEQVPDKLGIDALTKKATLALGSKGWEWVGDGDRLNRLGATGSHVKQSSKESGFFSGIGNWFGGLFAADPDVVLKEFYRNVERGNIDAAMNSMSDQFISFLGKQKLQGMLEHQREQIAAQGGIDSIDAETKVEGDKAIVKTVINFKNGKKKTEKTKLIKEGGKWKLVG